MKVLGYVDTIYIHTQATPPTIQETIVFHTSLYPQRDLLRIVDLQVFQIFKPHFCFQRPATYFIFPLIIEAYVEIMPLVRAVD